MTRASLAASVAFAAGAGLPLWVDRRAVDAGTALFHLRSPGAVWALALLVVPLVALGLWLRLTAVLVASSLAAGGAVSNAVALAVWSRGIPDYWALAGPGPVVNAGDVAIWIGLAGALAAAGAAAAGHLRRGGSLVDDVRALRRT